MVKAAQSRREQTCKAGESASPAVVLTPTATAPAVPVMTGTHFHALDEKGRVIIPAKLRPALTEQFWLMLDENDNIAIYNYQTGLDVLAHCEYMMAENPGDEDIAAAVERITGAAEMVNVEGNWRVPISELLRFHAQLDKEIVTVGVLNHAVLWSRERWEQAQARRLQSQDVRRTQAEILRAAASGMKIKKRTPDLSQQQPTSHGQEENEEAEAAAPAKAAKAGEAGRFVGDAGSGGRSVAEVASSGDGRRSPRVFALSQLGR